MKQTPDTGEQSVGKREYAKATAKWAGLKIAGGGLWLLASCAALLTIGMGIMTGLSFADKEYRYAGVWLAVGLGVAGVCAGCAYVARKIAERARALNPRSRLDRFSVPPPPDFDNLADAAQKQQAQLSALAATEAWSRERREKEAAIRQSRSPTQTFLLDRFYPLLLFIAGVTMVGWNHQSILHDHTLFFYPIIFGPPALWSGLAALFDPHILNPHYGVTRLGRTLFIAALVLSLFSILFLIWLYAVYYRLR